MATPVLPYRRPVIMAASLQIVTGAIGTSCLGFWLVNVVIDMIRWHISSEEWIGFSILLVVTLISILQVAFAIRLLRVPMADQARVRAAIGPTVLLSMVNGLTGLATIGLAAIGVAVAVSFGAPALEVIGIAVLLAVLGLVPMLTAGWTIRAWLKTRAVA